MDGNGEFILDEERFKRLSQEDRDWIFYKTFLHHRRGCDQRFCRIEEEVAQLKRRRRLDTTFSGMMGIVGGFLGMLTAKIFRW